MLLAERAGRKLERRSNSAPRGMAVIAGACKSSCRNKIRPIGLLQLIFIAPCSERDDGCRPHKNTRLQLSEARVLQGLGDK